MYLATEAGVDAVKAVALSDDDVRHLADKAVAVSDGRHQVAGPSNPYARRLNRLMGMVPAEAAKGYHLKVYLDPKVNAFAMANGSIRIYSGLMDRMNDKELLFVIGHEMGHVSEKHIKRKIMVAYAASALRKGIASQENMGGLIASSAIGGFVQALANAQFSQTEEQSADDFGLKFLIKISFSEDQAVDIASGALEKLALSSNEHSMMSSHPDPEKRADRMRSALDEKQDGSFVSGLMAKVKTWYEYLKEKVVDSTAQKENQ